MQDASQLSDVKGFLKKIIIIIKKKIHIYISIEGESMVSRTIGDHFPFSMVNQFYFK